MAIEKIGLNLTALNNINVPELNITKDPIEMLNEMPQVANEVTGYWLGYGILIGLFVAIYSQLSERFGNGFGYSELRSLTITAGIVTMFGYILVMIGYVHNFVPVGIMTGLFIMSAIYVSYKENKWGKNGKKKF